MSIKSLHPAEQYARDVVAHRIIASRNVRLACRRHIDDRENAHKRGLYFDEKAAQHAIDFFSFLKHSKGEWRGQSFKLEPWQQFIQWVVFGWKVRATGMRRFRTAYVEVARKNGKSTLCAGNGLYLAFADGEPGAEVYCAATKKDQARIVFTEAERMRAASPALKKRILKFRDNMNVPATASKFEPLGSDEDTLDGLNASAAIVDELHKHKTRDVWDVLETAMGSRRQGLMYAITTAGFNRESVCWKQHEYGERVLEGIIEDDTFFAYIAGLDKDDDWEDERNWQKANPNLLVSVKLDNMRDLARKAKNEPTALNAFLRLRLNKWTEQNMRWMPIDKWNACVGFSLEGTDPMALRRRVEEDLRGRLCIVGLDLSSKIDITASVKLFPPTSEDPRYIIVPDFWIPEENVEERVKKDRVPYDVWIKAGWLHATDGNVIDYDVIMAKILEDCAAFEVKEVAFDPWNATHLSTQLMAQGVTTVEFRQGFASMSEPTKQLMTLVLGKKLAHLGNPVLKWMASNMVVKQDEAGNLKPNKAKASEKIDGIVATVMALGRAIHVPSGGERTAYDDHGVFTV